MQKATAVKPSDRLREVARPVWDQIVAHPYIEELKAGTLPLETFRFYVQQDWLYLQEFTRTAAIIAGRCPDVEGMKFLLDWVQPLVGMEYHFHKKHAAQLDLDFASVTWEMNEANWAYTRHMLAAAHTGSTVEALAALLPCPCVYAHVGALLCTGPRCPNPMYQDWIDFYAPSREGLTPRIAAIQSLFDRLAASADPATLARCEWNYVVSSRYEWWFWDSTYNRVSWRP
jgi:thiaminase (transcriptional activator TenA)